MYKEQGTKEERNQETEERGILGTIMDGSQEQRSTCQIMPDGGVGGGEQDCPEAGAV